nr:MAG TPA: hypothetical protein [Bacteriophage sp.]
MFNKPLSQFNSHASFDEYSVAFLRLYCLSYFVYFYI